MKSIRHELVGTTARITLAAPERRNALTVELLGELVAALQAAGRSEARTVVLAADGPAFCAGMDLAELDSERLDLGLAGLLDALRAILECPKPVIARVHAVVRAGGIGLVAASDIVVCADQVGFAFTEARLALAPAVISPVVLPRIPLGEANRLFLRGSAVDAHEARRLGLVDEVVPADALDDAIDGVCADFAAATAQGLTETKRLLTGERLEALRSQGDALARRSAELFRSPEARAAIAAARAR